jgi:hypothetical protein
MAILQVNLTQVASLQQSAVDKNDFLAGGFSRPCHRLFAQFSGNLNQTTRHGTPALYRSYRGLI